MNSITKTPTPHANRKATIAQWSFALIEGARANFALVMADTPRMYRETIGTLHDWSPKDELAHLAYWIDIFATNIQAVYNKSPIINTRDYLAMNDTAWLARSNWSWEYIEQEVSRVLTATSRQIAQLEVDDLLDPTHFTVEPNNGKARPLIRSLLYELIDHPLHHFIELYENFDNKPDALALLTHTSSVLTQAGMSKWSLPSRRKIEAYRKRLQTAH